MKKRKTKPRKPKEKLTVEYEGVGTCINADIKFNGERVFTISACDPKYNAVVDKLIKYTAFNLRMGLK